MGSVNNRKKAGVKKAPQFSHMRKRQALIAARQMFGAQLQPDQMVDALMEQYMIPENTAVAIVKQAHEDIFAANTGLDPARTKAHLLHCAQELFADCKEQKNASAAVAVLKLQGTLHGIMRQDAHAPTLAAPSDEFSSRPEKDNRFFAEHGCWPEEYKPPKKRETATRDPLAKLH